MDLPIIPPHYVAIRPADIEATHEATDAVIASLVEAGFDGIGDHLGPIHVGLLCAIYDLYALPVPEALRSSRDVRVLVHSLADLETLELVERVHTPRLAVCATDGVRDAVRVGLDRVWSARASALEGALETTPDPRPTPRRGDDLQRWLRNIVVLLANTGLRLTMGGQIHAGDMRRIGGNVELPSSRFLGLCLEVATSMDVVSAMDTQLLIGNTIDLLDLPPADFAATALTDVAAGAIDVGHGHVSAMMGLLEVYVTPLREALPTYGCDLELADTVAPDPLSDFVPQTDADWPQAGSTTLIEAHTTARLGLLSLLGALPLGVAHPVEVIVELVHAHLARELLRRPARPFRLGDPLPVLCAAASNAMPWTRRRVAEHLVSWISAIWEPLGAARHDPERHTLTFVYPIPPLLERSDGLFGLGTSAPPAPPQPPLQGSIYVQPTGEILAPPDVSIHVHLHLAQGCDVVRLEEVITYQLTNPSLMRLLQVGMDVAVWGEALEGMSRVPIPLTVSDMITNLHARQGELTLAPASGVLIAEDAIRLDELLSHPRFANVAILRPAPTVAVLAPHCDLEALLAATHELGFAGVLVSATDDEA